MTSPSASSWRLTRRPLTSVPLVEPRSSTVTVPPCSWTSACLRLTPVSGSRMSASVPRPSTLLPGSSTCFVPGPSTTRTCESRWPARPTNEGSWAPVSLACGRSPGNGGSGGGPGGGPGGGGRGPPPAGGRGRGRPRRGGGGAPGAGDVRGDLEDAGAQLLVALEPHLDGVEGLVALGLDVLGDHVGQLCGQLVGPLGQVVVVDRAQGHDVGVGRQAPAAAEDGALLVG